MEIVGVVKPGWSQTAVASNLTHHMGVLLARVCAVGERREWSCRCEVTRYVSKRG